MAEGNSVGGLYLRLGLSLSELETGFVTAERTVAANIRRLNRESDLIRIRSEVEIAGLDKTEDAERILQIRTEALNRQMAIQRDRVRILTAELQNLTAAHGENSTVAQRAAVRLERERLTLANLERDLRSLNDAQGESNNSFGGLSDVLKILPPQLQAVAKGIGAVTAGAGAAAVSVNTLLADFKELQKQAFELNMSVGKTRDFLLQLRLGGGEITDFEGYIRGITDALVKGEIDDPEFIALRKYGAEITDATGRLKDFKDITDEVYRAWKQADAAGEGIEFLQLTGGESGIRDAIQFFKRYEEAKEDAAKIFKAEVDDKQLHELDRVMNLVAEQAIQLKNALGDIFVPEAQLAAENFFDVLRSGTQYLVENKDAIQGLGFLAAETFKTLGKETESTFSSIGEKIFEVNEMLKGRTGDSRVDKVLGDMSWRYGQKSPVYGIDAMIRGQVKDAEKSFGIFGDIVERAKKQQAEYNAEIKKTAESLAEMDKKLDKNPLSQYALQRVQSFKDELANLRIDLDFDSEIEKSKARLDLWLDQELTRKLFVSDDERSAIKELYEAKWEQINQAQAEIIQGYFKNAADLEYEMTHTAFEKQLRDIEQWEEAQRQKAATADEISAIIAESAAKEAKAFEDEMERIKGTIQSLEDKIFEQEHSQYENDLRRIQQERFRLYENYQKQRILTPDTQALIERYFKNAVGKLNKRADESRKSGGDYTKTPEGAVQSGGNGIMVIEADQIVDDGLIKAQQQQIGLLVEENQIRARLATKLNEAARLEVEKIQAAKALADAQKNLIQQASGFEVIEGDQVVNQPQNFQQIEGDQLLMPTQELQQFGETLQQTSEQIQQVNPLQEIADAQSAFVDSLKDFPPEYFKNLADNAKAVSEMQGFLTQSTMDLIKAQDTLAQKLSDLKVNPSKETSTDGVLKLSTLQVQELQPSPRREFSERSRDTGMKFGFDWDVASGVAGLGTLAIQLAQAVGAIAPHPAIKAGAMILGAGLGAGAGWGSWQETQAARELPDERLKAMPSDVDLSPLETSISGIGDNVQSILQSIQAENEAKFAEYLSVMPKIGDDVQSILQSMQSAKEIPDMPALQQIQMPEPPATLVDYLTPLNNIDGKLQSILQATQTQETISFETVVTPLNSINTLVGNILTALGNRQPPQINVSPNNNIDLGGAYVFDNAMKNALVTDITSKIVDEITSAVQKATSQASYGYGV